MGDSTCLMQPFSYTSGIPNDAHEGNPIHALGHSVSFGRFMSDSLAWEKWSSFSHNRYVEEAERYSKPGSVAQKKAFFEAHYKKIAAQRAAALLEQANAAAKSDNAKPQTKVPDPPKYMIRKQEEEVEVKGPNGFHPKVEMDKFESSEVVQVADLVARKLHQQEEEEAEDPHREEEALLVDTSGYNSSTEMENCERVHPIIEYPVWGENSAVAKLSTPTPMHKADTHNVEIVMELEHSGTLQMEKPLLKESHSSTQEALLPTRRKKPAILSLSKSSSIFHKAPKAPTSPAKPTASCFPRREGNATPLHKAHKAPTSPAKPTASCFPRREGNATPLHKKLASASEDKKRSTPKSLQKSVSFTPIRDLSRFTSTVMRKIENSRVGTSSLKTPKDCSTLLKTPTMVSKNEVHKHPSITPCSEKRRAKTPGDSSSVTGAKTFGPKWCSIRTDCSKILSACRNRAQSPFSSAAFSLRTEERAASRKKKLEEKFNADEAQQVQEKAEIEIRKFRQSLCFKARPLPDFYKERKAPHNDEIKKVPVTHSQKLGKKHSSNSAISVPPNEPSIKSSGTKHDHIQGRNKRTPTCSLISRSLKTVHENRSPNIQSS